MPKLEPEQPAVAVAAPPKGKNGRGANKSAVAAPPPTNPTPPAPPPPPKTKGGTIREVDEFLKRGERPVVYPKVQVLKLWASPPPAEDRDAMIERVLADVRAAMGADTDDAVEPVQLLSWLAGTDERAPGLWEAVKACIDGEDGMGALTREQAEALIGWETEDAFKARAAAYAAELEQAGNKVAATEIAAIAKNGFGDDFTCRDIAGKKVRCWNNTRNRPFDAPHGEKMRQTFGRREWAGPTTMPGETVNGETMIFSRSGDCESGQHRIIGFIKCCQEWAKAAPGSKLRRDWPEEPVLESLVVLGVSDSPRVIGTMDNVKPRTLADGFYTSDLFKDLGPRYRRECSKILNAAVDMLWKRVGAGSEAETKVLQTHQASHEFLDRHPRLLECVRHLYDCDTERALSKIALSPGACAAAMYLMATSNSNKERYRDSSNQLAFSEKTLDFGRWDKAKGFFQDLAKLTRPMLAVRNAISQLVAEDSGRTTEKLIVLAKAWANVLKNEPHDVDKIKPTMVNDPNGLPTLAEWTPFGGIDNGPQKDAPKGDIETEGAEERKQQERAAHFANMQDAKGGTNGTPAVAAKPVLGPPATSSSKAGSELMEPSRDPLPTKALPATPKKAPPTAAKKPDAATPAKPAAPAKGAKK